MVSAQIRQMMISAKNLLFAILILTGSTLGGCSEGSCTSNCVNKTCGDDGCGGSCGECMQGEKCIDHSCISCDCHEKVCGDDGCGGSCGECDKFPNSFCTEAGQCECSPNDCNDRVCGDDGCGGECPPGCTDTDVCNNLGNCVGAIEMTFIEIDAGTFTIGSPFSEIGRDDRETQHEVTLTHAFLIESTEVTQEEFESIMSYNPSHFVDCGPTCPVEMVNWHEAAAFCNTLSALENHERCYTCMGGGPEVVCVFSDTFEIPYDCAGYRLPTEAEWEYAARAGTTTATYNGTVDAENINCEANNPVLDSIAWFCGNSEYRTHPVGEKIGNVWGLYDMLGNVNEWCNDWYAEYDDSPLKDPWGLPFGINKMLRGGCYADGPSSVRAARRWSGSAPVFRIQKRGFRPVRSLHQ